jgi:CRP-like cAMP-binding protein
MTAYDCNHTDAGNRGTALRQAPDAVALRHLAAGELLFRQGDGAAAIFRLVSGAVRLLRHTPDGASVVMHVARPGETFSEAALFADHYHCDAAALTPSCVEVLHKSDLLRTMHADPQTTLALTRALARQVRDLRARLEIRNLRKADERLLAWLRLRAAGLPPNVMLDGTWTEVAEEVGLTREATYRALAALRRTQRIAIDGKRVDLIDRR